MFLRRMCALDLYSFGDERCVPFATNCFFALFGLCCAFRLLDNVGMRLYAWNSSSFLVVCFAVKFNINIMCSVDTTASMDYKSVFVLFAEH